MHDRSVPKIAKWPFFLGDVLLLGAAGAIFWRASSSLTPLEGALMAGCIALGAFLAVLPFMLEYRAVMKVAEAAALTNVVSQIGQMEGIAGQITGATGRWHMIQEESEKTTAAARQISERMTEELKTFSDFIQRSNDSEKATLRLEAEKLRRGEGEWLQIVVRMLDHVYALNQGAVRSGQPKLIQQLSNFQNACREAARRVGLEPFVAAPNEPYDPEKHQPADGGEPAPGAVAAETVATGYTFQGQLLRRPVVRVSNGPAGAPADSGATPGLNT